MNGENTTKAASAMWGGRFKTGPSQVMEQINASIDFDKRLFEQDIAASKAHCAMLAAQGVISQADATAIAAGLEQVLGEIRRGEFTFKTALEDIHMNVESRLKEIIGEAAGRLHTARSRNDQVAVDFRLWVRDAIDGLDQGMRALQAVLIGLAETHAGDVMPGFTHLQAAQPVTFGHHMLAYVEMLGRDRSRLADGRKRMNECPLGAAALAGTPYPIDRHATAQALGFDRPTKNSLDSVSDRDFALEFLANASLCALHLSRLAEELVIWSTPQFAFISLSDGFSTGSSIMPQKRNPDAAELVRAKCGRIIGALSTLMTVMKGLPLAYSKDMQEDKEPVFEAADTLALCLTALTGMMADVTVNTAALQRAAAAGFITATDLADWCVRVLGMPFRDAHHVAGSAVKRAEEKGCALADLSLADYQAIDRRITKDVFNVLTVEHSVTSRTSFGGTSPDNVRAQAQAARAAYL